MYCLVRTTAFERWEASLRDQRARIVIFERLARVEFGNFGHYRSVGDNVFELKVDFGPGYRVYFTLRGGDIVLLLCGGDKDSQSRDIARAKRLKREILT